MTSRAASEPFGDVGPPARRLDIPRRLLRASWWLQALLYLVPAAIGLLAWEWLARYVGLPLLFPGPVPTLERFWRLLAHGPLLPSLWASVVRIVVGFSAGSAVGILIGLAMGASRRTSAALGAYVHFLRFIPPIVWFPVILLWFGAGQNGKYFLIAYTSIFVVAINTAVGVTAIPPDKLRMGRTFGASRWQIVWRVRLPASAPYIFTGMRVALGNAIATIVAAEMLASTNGIGYLLVSGQNFLDPEETFSAMIALGFLGIVADFGFRRAIDKFGGRFAVNDRR